MAFDDAALLKKVRNRECEAFQKNKTLLLRVCAYDDLIEAAYNVHCPNPFDYEKRRDLIRIFNLIARELYGTEKLCPVVEEFGSFLMDMCSSDSDLDLSINFNNSSVELQRDERIKTLRKFAKKFYTLQRHGLVKNVQAILNARVPVLKVTDCGTNIECDISVENRDGIAKSRIVFMIAAIDDRFRKLSILLKAWAKAQGINSSKNGTLNSLSLVSLAAFHLQRREPPILPPFFAILRDGFDTPSVKKHVSHFLNYGQKNMESLLQLFVTLLIRLRSAETLWDKGLCASIYEGSWIYKTFDDKNRNISVEDFTDRSQNVARAVGSPQVIKIYECIEKSLSQIESFVNGTIEGQKLEELLFGPAPSHVTKYVMNHDQCTPFHPVLFDLTPTKRMRLEMGREGTSSPSQCSRINRPGKGFNFRTRGTSQRRRRLARRAETFGRMGSYATHNSSTVMQGGDIRTHERRSTPVAYEYFSSQPVLGFPPALPDLSLNPHLELVAPLPLSFPQVPYPGQLNPTQIWLNPSEAPRGGFPPPL